MYPTDERLSMSSVHLCFKDDRIYLDRLCLQDNIYWDPGATEDEIYGQMSQKKYQELPRSSVHLREALGEGEFGDVYRGEWQSPMGCVEVAVKVSKNSLELGERVKLLQEAAVMGQFLHPHVVRLFGVVTLGQPVSLSYMFTKLNMMVML